MYLIRAVSHIRTVKNLVVSWIGFKTSVFGLIQSLRMSPVFNLDLVCKEELNLELKVSDFQSRCSGFELKRH